MIITNNNRKAFLKTKPFAFQSGWLAAEDGYKHPVTVVGPEQVRKDFQEGFKTYMDNSFTAQGSIEELCPL
jgi:hypothetical protein